MAPRELPPAHDYSDLPPWQHNFDNARVRAINAAWNMLLTKDFSAIAFRDLAEEVGVTPQALYHHLPSLDALAAELAKFAVAAVRDEMFKTFEEHRDEVRTFRTFLEFVHHRPHHTSLGFSPRFHHHAGVLKERQKLDLELEALLKSALGRAPRPTEVLELRVTLLGLAAVLGARGCTVKQAAESLEVVLQRQRRPQTGR